jgi:hypothetical protein
MVGKRDGSGGGEHVRDIDALHQVSPIAQTVFSAPELWLILQAIGSVPAEPTVPSEAGFDARALVDARAGLLHNGTLAPDAQGNISLALGIVALVLPAIAPESVIIANITDRGSQDQAARIICFCRRADLVVVNWVDTRSVHHFVAYHVRAASACVVHHLSQACNLDVIPPGASQPASTPRDVERASEQMIQAVSLSAMKGLGTPEQTVHATGWFISNGRAWLIPPPANGQPSAPRCVSRADIIGAVQTLVEL